MLDINKPKEVVTPVKKDIPVQELIVALLKKLPSIGLTNILLVGLTATVLIQNGLIKIPGGSVVPNNPVVNEKTLRDEVSPEAAVELGDFWHAIAMAVKHDVYVEKDSEGKSVEKHIINTVGDFDTMMKRSVTSFQAITNLTGIGSIREPIKTKLTRATGSLNSTAPLDDPATKVRQSIIAVCKEISEEFNPEMRKVSLDRVR